MVFGKFVNCFKTAILKNKSERLLLRFSAKAALSEIKMQAAAPTQLINRKGLSQSSFTENVTKFSRALNQKLTRASAENNSGKDLIC